MNLLKPIRIWLSPEKELLQSVRNIFGFLPDNISLYKLAFCHRSAAQEKVNGMKMSNERLEYLGDAVLGSVVADYLFKKFPYRDEGFLTEMRSRIVNRVHLNKLSVKLGIDLLLPSVPPGQQHQKSVHGDAFEAFIGAIYLDKGYDFAKKVIISRIIDVHVDLDRLEKEGSNSKSLLIEWSQKEKLPLEFRMAEEKGHGRYRQYMVELWVNNELVATGQDYSIKGAEYSAAEKACSILSLREI
ncbi:MAG: ribonuclease III [Bacteroidales bacterium]|nr:ribonuclease III [Bacteroidales bacterium]